MSGRLYLNPGTAPRPGAIDLVDYDPRLRPPGHVEAKATHLIGERGIIADQDAPFTGGDVLDGMKGEDGVAGTTDLPGSVSGSDRMGRIFDERNSVLVGYGS